MVECADPCSQGSLQRGMTSILDRAEGLPCRLEHGCLSRHLLGYQVEQGQNDAGRSCSTLPVRQRLLKCPHGRAMDIPRRRARPSRLALSRRAARRAGGRHGPPAIRPPKE